MKTTFARIWKNPYAQLTTALLILADVFTPNANADPITYTLQVMSFPGDVGPSGTVGSVPFGRRSVVSNSAKPDDNCEWV